MDIEIGEHLNRSAAKYIPHPGNHALKRERKYAEPMVIKLPAKDQVCVKRRQIYEASLDLYIFAINPLPVKWFQVGDNVLQLYALICNV